MINALKVIFSLIFIWVTYVVISTSMQSNLFKEWDFLGSIPWMRATLWDFYANIFIISCWMFYKEKLTAMKVVWLVLFITLGSIATTFYILLKLFKLKPNQGVAALLVNR